MYNLQQKDACHSGTQLRNFHFLTDTRVIKAATRYRSTDLIILLYLGNSMHVPLTCKLKQKEDVC